MSGQPKRIGCVIVAHGNVAQCLMDAVQGILGKQANWVAISNAGMGLKELKAEVTKSIERLCRDCDVLLMSDMPGGSCHHVCQEVVSENKSIHALTGVNLMMLLEFFVKRERSSLEDLAVTVKERGRDSVRAL